MGKFIIIYNFMNDIMNGALMNKLKIKSEVRLDADIIYSKAYKEIMSSGAAITALMRFYQKRKWCVSKVRGKKKIVYSDEPFIFPYAEMKDLWDIGTTQTWKIIKRLVEVGFIDVDHQGGWYQKNKKERDFSRYKLSDRWRKYGTPEFEKVEKRKVLQEHLYIRENIARKNLKATSLKRSDHLHKSECDMSPEDNYRLHESEVDQIDTKDLERSATLE